MGLFTGFIRDFEKAMKNVSRELTDSAFDKANKLTDKVDHISEKRVKEFVQGSGTQLGKIAKKLDYTSEKRVKEFVQGSGIQLEKLEERIVLDIEDLINKADERVKSMLDELDKIRQETIKDLTREGKQIDSYMENRINQFTLTFMKSMAQVEAVTEKKIVEIQKLEEKIFGDADILVDKVSMMLNETVDSVKFELRRYIAHFVPNPFDPCRKEEGIPLVPGPLLSDWDIYKLTRCYELKKLKESTPILQIIEIYGQLQVNAVRMSILVRHSPSLKQKTIEDWLNFGMLAQDWENTEKIYGGCTNVPSLNSYDSKLLQ